MKECGPLTTVLGQSVRQLQDIYDYREMIWNLVLRDLRERYRGSMLGFAWTLVNPLLLLAVYSFVFSFIMKADIEHYPLFILIALLPWNYMTQAMSQGAVCFLTNMELMKKIYFPREVLPLAALLSHLINNVLTMTLLLPVLWLTGVPMKLTLLAFPFVLLVQTLLVLLLVMALSIGTVYMRDLQHLLSVFTMVWFYMTPIIYPISLIPASFRWVFDLNPFTPLAESYRSLLFYGTWPDFTRLSIMALVLLALNGIVFHLFAKMQGPMVEEL